MRFVAYANKFLAQNAFVHWRVTHWQDLVIHMPPKTLQSYRHVGTEVFYDSSFLKHRVCDGSGEDPSCSDSKLGYSINDHIHYFGIQVGTDCD